MKVTVADRAAGERLDRFLRRQFPDWGRQAVQRAIAGRQVSVNQQTVWLASWEVRSGDQVEVRDPPAPKPVGPAEFDPAWLIAEEPDLIAVNKPAGLLAEPARAPASNLRDLAQARFGPLTLIHRLDRDTSGVLILTRSAAANQALTEAFRRHQVRKEYLAVVTAPNRLAAAGVITERLGPHPGRRDQMAVVAAGGQRAVTRYAVAAAHQDLQLVRLWPETGRTHQLRVHLAHLGAPIVGDRLYGGRPAARLLLHAYTITLPPFAGQPERTFVAAPPREIAEIFADISVE